MEIAAGTSGVIETGRGAAEVVVTEGITNVVAVATNREADITSGNMQNI